MVEDSDLFLEGAHRVYTPTLPSLINEIELSPTVFNKLNEDSDPNIKKVIIDLDII